MQQRVFSSFQQYAVLSSWQVRGIEDWHEGNSIGFIFEETAAGTGERWVKSDAMANGK